MKYLRALALVALAIEVLSGCGGGSGLSSPNATKLVTIKVQLQWPGAASKAIKSTRAVPAAATFAIIEVFSGVTRVASTTLTQNIVNGVPTTYVSSANMSVPATSAGLPLTFYANAYSSSSGIIVGADGQLTASQATSPATGLFPVIAGNPVLAHAISTQTVSSIGTSPTISFTLNNTVASIIGVTGMTSVALDATPATLFNTVTALDANGATVMVSATELTWAYANSAASARVLISPATPPNPANPATNPGYTLMPLATGAVNLVVSDTQVNTGQAPISSVVQYTITAPAPVTLQLDASTLAARCPLYAGSIKLRVTESPLAGDPNDVAGVVTDGSGKSVETVTFVPGAPPSVTIPTVSYSYIYSGRPFTLTIDAYSGSSGSGVKLAETVSTSIAGDQLLPSVATVNPPLTRTGTAFTYTATADTSITSPNNFFLPAAYKISAITVTPVTSSIYYFNPAQTVAGLPSNVQLQAAVTGPGIPTPLPINAQTVQWAPAPTALASSATVSITGVASTNQAVAVTSATAVAITATDFRAPTAVAQGKATVTVNDGQITLGIQ